MKFWKLFKYSYCDGCGFTLEKVTSLYLQENEYPVYYCETCINTYNIMKENKKEEKAEAKIAKKTAKAKVKVAKSNLKK